MQSFSTLVQLKRQEAKLSQEELSAMVDVSQQAVQKWESGENRPAPAKWSKLAKALQISEEEIVCAILGNTEKNEKENDMKKTALLPDTSGCEIVEAMLRGNASKSAQEQMKTADYAANWLGLKKFLDIMLFEALYLWVAENCATNTVRLASISLLANSPEDFMEHLFEKFGDKDENTMSRQLYGAWRMNCKRDRRKSQSRLIFALRFIEAEKH